MTLPLKLIHKQKTFQLFVFQQQTLILKNLNINLSFIKIKNFTAPGDLRYISGLLILLTQ